MFENHTRVADSLWLVLGEDRTVRRKAQAFDIGGDTG